MTYNEELCPPRPRRPPPVRKKACALPRPPQSSDCPTPHTPRLALPLLILLSCLLPQRHTPFANALSFTPARLANVDAASLRHRSLPPSDPPNAQCSKNSWVAAASSAEPAAPGRAFHSPTVPQAKSREEAPDSRARHTPARARSSSSHQRRAAGPSRGDGMEGARCQIAAKHGGHAATRSTPSSPPPMSVVIVWLTVAVRAPSSSLTSSTDLNRLLIRSAGFDSDTPPDPPACTPDHPPCAHQEHDSILVLTSPRPPRPPATCSPRPAPCTHRAGSGWP